MTTHQPIYAARLLACLLAAVCGAGDIRAAGLLDRLDGELPQSAADCSEENAQRVGALAAQIDRATAELVWRAAGEGTGAAAGVQPLVAVKSRLDARLDQLLDLRTEFAALADDETRRSAVQAYLAMTSHLIDVSGRTRYALLDALLHVPYAPGGSTAELESLLDLLARERVSIGAYAMAYLLFEPPDALGIRRFPRTLQHKTLELMADAGTMEVVPVLAEFLRQTPPDVELVVPAAEAMTRIGLPQSARPEADAEVPPPAMTPAELHSILAGLSPADDPRLEQRRQALLQDLDQRSRRGIDGDMLRVGRAELRAGDWLLMRNPSPYNRFTELSPGLFTHVGVLAAEEGTDGIRRLVVVDLPERGSQVPATNVDAYLARTVHYVFLRHADVQAAEVMGRVAASLIGRESQFDLNFRTDRVSGLRGRLDDVAVLHTYCAGFLLVCAQETGRPREEFFPLVERAAGGHCAENLERMGLSIGDQFVSPTGALFSPHLQLVARREPMYSADREVKERIYDHFAQCMIDKRLQLDPDLYQALRQQVAALARHQPWLARALARANNVHEKMDLEAAAKAASVVETLDQIADHHMDEYLFAMQAMWAGPPENLQGLAAQARAQIARLRAQHADLYRQWTAGQLSPRDLRLQLLDAYVRQGNEQVERKFFGATSPGSE